MKNYSFILFFVFGVFFQNLYCQTINRHPVFLHDTIAELGHFYFNHAPQILYIKEGTILPNNDILTNSRILVSAYAGLIEAGEDTNIWICSSDDEGVTWSLPDTLLTTDESSGPKVAFNGSLFLGKNNRIFQLILYQNGPGGGAFGTFPIFLQYKFSDDAGISWSLMQKPFISGIEDTSTFRIIGPFCKPIDLHQDTMGFPLYYRIVGDPTAHFAFLVISKDFQYWHLKKFPDISLTHPDRLIEPFALIQNDTLFSYFRTTTGKIWYYISNNAGNSWNGPHIINTPHPGTLFNGFVYENEKYFVTNLSTDRRESLSLINLQTPVHNPKFLFEIDNIDDVYQQVTYPSVDISHPDKLLVAYSGVGLDYNKGRFGDIFISIIEKDSIEYWTNNNFEWDSAEVKFSFDSDFTLLSSHAVQSNLTYFADSRGMIKEINLLDYSHITILPPNTNSILYQIDNYKDSITICTNSGWYLKSPLDADWSSGPFIGGASYFATPYDEQQNKWLLHRGRKISFFEHGQLINEIDLSVITGTSESIAIIGVNQLNGEILVLSDYSKTYISTDTLNSLQLLNDNCPQFPTSLIQMNGNWYCGTALGDIYELLDNQLFWDLKYSNELNYPLQKINIMGDTMILVYTNGYRFIDNEFNNLTSLSFDPSKFFFFDSEIIDNNLVLYDKLGKIVEVSKEEIVNNKIVEKNIDIPVVFPNPTSGFLNYSTDNMTKWEIRSIDGTILIQESGFSNENIDISRLSTGLYFLIIKQGRQIYTYKIMKN
jgi:hypothetical protein